MIEESFEIGPVNEKLKQHLRAPFSLVVSPAEDVEIVKSPVDASRFPRCGHCQAYFSSLCDKDANSWTCCICSKKNEGAVDSQIPGVNEVEMCVEEDEVGLEVIVLYLSLGFNRADIDVMRPGVMAFFKLLKTYGRPVMLLFGHGEAVFAACCPYMRCYSVENGVVRYAPPAEWNDSFESMPAPVALINRRENIDFSSFIFAPEQIESLLVTVQNITNVPVDVPYQKCLDTAAHLANNYSSSPVHMINVLPIVDTESDFDFIAGQCFRFDVMTPSHTHAAHKLMADLPGTIMFFTKSNVLASLKYFVAASTVYQTYFKCRARGVSPSVRTSFAPCSMCEDGVEFIPVLPDHKYPVVVDLKPEGKETGVLQITAKMTVWNDTQKKHTTILRVLTRSIKMSANQDEIIDSLKPNVVLWLWLTRTLDQPISNVIAGLFRTSAAIIALLAEDDPNAQQLTHAICALKKCDLMNADQWIRSQNRYALCLTPPRHFPLCPEFVADKNYARIGNTVYADNTSNEAAVSVYHQIPVNPRIFTPIPEWVKTPDPAALDFLNSLL